MQIIFKTNGNFYNVMYISRIDKIGDTQLQILMTNNMKYIETYPDQNTRDKVYDDFMNEFVKDEDNSGNTQNKN